MVMLTKPQSLKQNIEEIGLFNFIPEYEMVQMERYLYILGFKKMYSCWKIFKNYKI